MVTFPKKLFFLFLFIALHTQSSWANSIVKVSGNKALIKFTGTPPGNGKLLVVTDSNGKAKGVLKVVKIKGQGGIGQLVKGTVSIGQIAVTKEKFLAMRKSQKVQKQKPQEQQEQQEQEEQEEQEEQGQEGNEEQNENLKDESQTEDSENQNTKKTFNIKTNPLGAAVGFINVDAEFFLGNMGLGISYTKIDATINDIDIAGTSMGGRLDYFFNGPPLNDGWYLSFIYGTVTVDVTTVVSTVTVGGEVDGSFFTGMFGYLWAWKNFNLSAGAGFASYGLDESIPTAAGNLDVPLAGGAPVVELSIGFAF
jgi:hypothetical protein